MPLYQIDIEKYLQGPGFLNNFWTNVYFADSTDLAAAQTVAASILALERAVHLTTVTFTKYRVREKTPGATGQISTISLAGQRTVSGDALPLFNVVRVDLNTGTGRPSRKYLRCPLQEAEQANGSLTTTYISAFNTAYRDPLLAISSLRDVDNQPFVSATTITAVGMRQLRRGSTRRNNPVI